MSTFGLAPVRFGGISMVTATLGDNDPEVGTMCEHDGAEYRFVYNDGNSQITPGHAAVLSAVAGYSCTVSSTTSVDFAVGVCKHATLTTGTYGWLMTKGFGQVQMGANESCAAGALLVLASDGKLANKTSGIGYTGNLVGKAMSAIASGASGAAYISI